MRCGIVGQLSNTAEDPQKLIRTAEAQKTLSLLSSSPGLSRPHLEREVKPDVLEQLILQGVIREDRESRLHIEVPVWRSEDARRLNRAVTRVLPSLASEIRAPLDTVESMLDSFAAADLVGSRQIASLVVGCFALDWGVIHGLNARGVVTMGRPLEDGSQYLLNLYEDGYQVDAGLCSSHKHLIERYFFTTFGSAHGYRLGFPDLLPLSGGWPLSTDPRFTTLKERYGELRREMDVEPAAAAGRLIEGLVKTGGCAEPSPLTTFLQEIGYLDGAMRPCSPVIVEGDIELVAVCVNTVVDAVIEWLPGIREEFGDLSPVTDGITWESCLMEIWHVLFGQMNLLLVREGFFELPGPGYDGEGTYIRGITASYDSVKDAVMG